MPRTTPPATGTVPTAAERDRISAELDHVQAAIEQRKTLLRDDVAAHTEHLTRLHTRADELRRQLNITDININTGHAPLRAL